MAASRLPSAGVTSPPPSSMRRDLVPLGAMAAGISVVVALIWGRAPAHVPPLIAAFNACLEAAGFGFFPMLVGEGAMTCAASTPAASPAIGCGGQRRRFDLDLGEVRLRERGARIAQAVG